jgi:hypothetical protein
MPKAQADAYQEFIREPLARSGPGSWATADPYPPSTRASSESTRSADATRSPVQPSACLPVMVHRAEILSAFVPVRQAGPDKSLRGRECSISERCQAQADGLCYCYFRRFSHAAGSYRFVGRQIGPIFPVGLSRLRGQSG